MKKFVSALCAGSLSLTFALVPTVPSVAAPMMPKIESSSDVQTIQYRDDRRWKNRGHGSRYQRDHNRRGHWKGYRGERHKRHGYRRHNDGHWYPLAAFGLGAIIGGTIANQQAPVYRERRVGNDHIQWCYGQYRSYRASDNTFQPYNGPRQQCYSPY